MSSSFGETLKPAKYVVAVSGGVDSIVLLDFLSKQKLELFVAHFDHGMREDSAEDCKFVANLAKDYNLPFTSAQGKLGAASEAVARKARYDFLHSVRKEYGAVAIVTAHHKDDVVETLIINILRGTNRRGLSSLRSADEVKRPLLDRTKSEIKEYAKQYNLSWREDSTNKDTKILRNYIRHELLPKMRQQDPQIDEKLFEVTQSSAKINDEIYHELTSLNLKQSKNKIEIPRYWLSMVGAEVGREVLYDALKKLNPEAQISKEQLKRAYEFSKVGKLNKKFDLHGGVKLEIAKGSVVVTRH